MSKLELRGSCSGLSSLFGHAGFGADVSIPVLLTSPPPAARGSVKGTRLHPHATGERFSGKNKHETTAITLVQRCQATL